MMKRIDALKDGKKVALLKEKADGSWKVFVYENRQTFALPATSECKGWTEGQAKAFITHYIEQQVIFQER